MYLHLDKTDADLVQTILLSAQIKYLDECEEELKNESFNSAHYNAADYVSRRLGLILEQFDD